ncbi:MAG: hypothetical protein IJH39_07660 [Clostridia bacterium]|nr:hypothetical protein [Clostridia bacterium]
MQKRKTIIAVLVILTMVLAIIPFKAFAVGESYTITFSVAPNANGYHDGQTDTDVAHTVIIEDQHLKIDGQFVDPRLASAPNDNTFNGYTLQQTGENTVAMTITNGEEVVLNFNTANNYMLKNGENNMTPDTTTISGTTNVQVFDYVAPQQQPQPGGEGEENPPAGNTNAIIRVSGTTGSYTDKHYNPNTNTEEETQVPYAKSYVNARFSVNDGQVRIIEEDENNPPASADVPVNFNSEDADTTVTIYFRSLFLWEYKDKVTVNNVDYNIPFDYTNREAWLDHYDRQEIVFGITVPKAANNVYETVVKLQPAEHVFIGNFLWTANPDEEFRLDPQGNKEENDDYVGHSKIEFVRVKYKRNGQTITKEKDELNGLGGIDERGNAYTELSSGDKAVEVGLTEITAKDGKKYQEGSMTVAEGAEVTLRIVPDYGYQATSFGINGDDLITGDNISEFTFVIREGNAHIGAKVTAVNNDVKSTSSAVTGGKLVLPDEEITTGTARLSVSDADVSEAKKEEFKKQVGDEYEISSILGVGLNQVFYKGNNGSDVWTGDALEELNGEATIGLALKDGIDPTNSVIVHNVHDGEEFETIEISEYDENTQTAYFKGKTFSNYAIATKVSKTDTKKEDDSKTSSTQKANSVKTGDKIIIFVGTFLAATMVLIIIRKSRRSRRISKH